MIWNGKPDAVLIGAPDDAWDLAMVVEYPSAEAFGAQRRRTRPTSLPPSTDVTEHDHARLPLQLRSPGLTSSHCLSSGWP